MFLSFIRRSSRVRHRRQPTPTGSARIARAVPARAGLLMRDLSFSHRERGNMTSPPVILVILINDKFSCVNDKLVLQSNTHAGRERGEVRGPSFSDSFYNLVRM